MKWISDELQQLEHNDQLRKLRVRQSPHVGGMVQLDGKRYLDFSSNDYLALSSDSRLVDAVRQAAGHVGWGSGASPLISGFGVLQQTLQQTISNWKDVEASLLFPSGFATNVGVITALADKDSVIFSDQLNHASIIDGCRLSGAKVVVYRHADMDHLAGELDRNQSFERKLIVTDSLFSMDGDIAPLKELVELKQKHDAMLIVDEAHAAGIFGQRGSGLCEHFEVEDQVDVRVGTLSKAVGSVGGFVASSQLIYDWLINRARSYIFSTAQPEAISAAAIEAINIIRDDEAPRIKLLDTSHWFRKQCHDLGLETGDSNSQIIPVILGTSNRALDVCQRLLELGIFAPAIRPPAVPQDQSRLRITITSAHSRDQIEQLLDALKRTV